MWASANNVDCYPQDAVSAAEALQRSGEQFIQDDHYAVDCIRPKCLELQRICEQYRELVRQRRQLLQHSAELHATIQSVRDHNAMLY